MDDGGGGGVGGGGGDEEWGELRNRTLEKRLVKRHRGDQHTRRRNETSDARGGGLQWVRPLRPSLIAGHEGFSTRHHGVRPSLHRKHMHTLKDEQAVERGQTQDFNRREVPFVLFKYLHRKDVIRAGAGLRLFHWVFQFLFSKCCS